MLINTLNLFFFRIIHIFCFYIKLYSDFNFNSGILYLIERINSTPSIIQLNNKINFTYLFYLL